VEVNLAVDLVLPAEATSASQARRLLREALAEVEHDDAWADAEVAVSEIVTNALVHAGTPMRLRVLVGSPGLRVEVGDGNPHLPHSRDYSAVASTGRGLHVVGEVVDRWGAYPSGAGKVVWFEIAVAGHEVAGNGEPPPPATDAVEIELINIPLLMHAAWQEHAAALLRELLLVRLDEDETALESHAAASDALSLLFEQIPAPDLGTRPESIMAAATEPRVSRDRIVLSIPPSSTAHFELLDSALLEAVAMADAGALLCPPTQPEIQSMRRWLCEQVRVQARGGDGRAWASPTNAAPPRSRQALAWDPGPVRASARALLAADDTDRIVAASPSALALLGYADAAALEGNRLTSIIPARFHQAHISGFTLHLVNGRSPLLGRLVQVPVCRADGSETRVDLYVESVAVPHGRRVFIAEFGG
jgi:PAS domain S-box-containing protein